MEGVPENAKHEWKARKEAEFGTAVTQAAAAASRPRISYNVIPEADLRVALAQHKALMAKRNDPAPPSFPPFPPPAMNGGGAMPGSVQPVPKMFMLTSAAFLHLRFLWACHLRRWAPSVLLLSPGACEFWRKTTTDASSAPAFSGPFPSSVPPFAANATPSAPSGLASPGTFPPNGVVFQPPPPFAPTTFDQPLASTSQVAPNVTVNPPADVEVQPPKDGVMWPDSTASPVRLSAVCVD